MIDLVIRRAGRWDPLIQQGSSFARTLRFGFEITGYQFRGQIRRSHDDAEVLASYAFAPVDESRVTVLLTAAQTAALPAERLVHDIEIFTAADAFVARVIEGRVRVTPEVTR
jgi:hypothetical protein